MPSIKQMPSGNDGLPSIRAETKGLLTLSGTIVSENAGNWIFLVVTIGNDCCCLECPIFII